MGPLYTPYDLTPESVSAKLNSREDIEIIGTIYSLDTVSAYPIRSTGIIIGNVIRDV